MRLYCQRVVLWVEQTFLSVHYIRLNSFFVFFRQVRGPNGHILPVRQECLTYLIFSEEWSRFQYLLISIFLTSLTFSPKNLPLIWMNFSGKSET